MEGNSRKRQALGRGLGALIPGVESRKELFYCPLEDINISGDQPRFSVNNETLNELAESIRQSGVLQPVLVRREDDKYCLIAGERRVRAARMAGLDRIPVLVRQIEDDQVFALALIENIQREDLTPLEEAQAYRRLLEDHGYTQKELADRVGKGRSTIANSLRLLELPEPIQDHVASGRLSAGHARAVLAAPSEQRIAFAQEMVDQGLSVRQAEERAKPRPPKEKKPERPTKPAPRPVDERQANLSHLESRLREHLQARVRIVDRRNGGRIEIDYHDDDMLEAITNALLGE